MGNGATADEYNRVRNCLIGCFGNNPGHVNSLCLDRSLTHIFVHLGKSISSEDLVQQVNDTVTNNDVVTNDLAQLHIPLLPEEIVTRCYNAYKNAN